MRRSLRYLCAPVAALAIVATWGVLPASADSTRVVHPGQSIQAAIDASRPGATIVVQHGTYAENLEILKGDIHLVGHDATLVPPAAPHPGSRCIDPSDPTVNGICIVSPGFDPATGVVSSYLKGTDVRGFTIRGFTGSGLVALGAQDTDVRNNRFVNNAEYGAAAFTSKQTEFEHNVSITNALAAEAGFYIGDSPNAQAEVEYNESVGAQFGVFVRDAKHAHIEHNDLHGNCVGVIFLANAPGPAGSSNADHNNIHDNDKFCPSGEEGGPTASGIGVASVGATDTHVHENRIVNNVPTGNPDITGGLVVITAPGDPTVPQPPSLPVGNHMTSNTVHGNGLDIFWDGTGTDNLFFDNHCTTSAVATNLCKK